MAEDANDLNQPAMESGGSIANLFRAASQELAQSDARIYRSIDRHLRRTREILAEEEESWEWRKQATRAPKEFFSAPRLLRGAPSYERQPRKMLERLCREHEIRGYSRMSKAVMISQLKAKGVEPPPLPLEAFTKAELLELIEQLTTRQEDDYES